MSAARCNQRILLGARPGGPIKAGHLELVDATIPVAVDT